MTAEILSSDDPVPQPGGILYQEELNLILTRMFRVCLAEIFFGVGVCFFAIQLFLWPFFLGLVAISIGSNGLCHYRDYSQMLSNDCCCCGALGSSIAHYWTQPFLVVASLGGGIASGVLAISLDTPIQKNRDVTQASVGIGFCVCLGFTALFAALVVGRLRVMIELHPTVGDPHSHRGVVASASSPASPASPAAPAASPPQTSTTVVIVQSVEAAVVAATVVAEPTTTAGRGLLRRYTQQHQELSSPAGSSSAIMTPTTAGGGGGPDVVTGSVVVAATEGGSGSDDDDRRTRDRDDGPAHHHGLAVSGFPVATPIVTPVRGGNGGMMRSVLSSQ